MASPSSKRPMKTPRSVKAALNPESSTASPSSRRTELTTEDQQRINNVHEVLTNREQLIWLANTRHDSVAQTELHFTKLLHRPYEAPRQSRPLFQDAKLGDKVPDEVWQAVRKKDMDSDMHGKKTGKESSKKGDARGKGKTKEQAPVKKEENNDMEIGVEGDEEEEEEEGGGVPIAPGAPNPR